MHSEQRSNSGHIFWLFGLSGAGKSTLANRLAHQLRKDGIPVLTLDGDVLRATLCQGLGFSESDRTENLRRAASVAQIGLESDLTVVASFITPLESQRLLITGMIPPDRLNWVYIDAPIEVCQSRDVKGLYSRARAGGIAQMTGVSATFEPPRRADLILSTANESINQSAEKLLVFCRRKQASFSH